MTKSERKHLNSSKILKFIEYLNKFRTRFQTKFIQRFKKAAVCVGFDDHLDTFPFSPNCSAKGAPPQCLDQFLACLMRHPKTFSVAQSRALPTPQSDLENNRGSLLKRQTSSGTTRAGSACSLKIVQNQCKVP